MHTGAFQDQELGAAPLRSSHLLPPVIANAACIKQFLYGLLVLNKEYNVLLLQFIFAKKDYLVILSRLMFYIYK